MKAIETIRELVKDVINGEIEDYGEPQSDWDSLMWGYLYDIIGDESFDLTGIERDEARRIQLYGDEDLQTWCRNKGVAGA